jgi:hypothetical protein
VRLCHISVPHLIAEAGGDPWAINQSLRSGRPAQISSLAQAFHDAGQATNEADAAFSEARRRFERSWNRENGDHPINDAAEVQRATQSLGKQAAQLPMIAVDLQSVAAVLAEAQRAAGGQIVALERQLEEIDRQLDEALKIERSGQVSGLKRVAVHEHIYQLEQQAIDGTAAALHQVEHIRDQYSGLLHRLMTKIRGEDGYDAAPVAGLDGYDDESPEQAEIDVHATLAGDQLAAARVNSVLNSITAEQRAGTLPLTPEQASVLSQLQAQQHGMSISALLTAEQRLGDHRELIGNSWQLMSNAALAFPRTDLKTGAVQGTETAKGGAAQLPDSVQRALNASGLAYANDMGVVAGIVTNGNSALQRSTELDRGMIRKGSAMINVPLWSNDPASHGESDGRDPWLDPLVSNVLSAVSPDHQVVHDVLTGPDRDTFLHNITRHFWLDNGKGVASLFDWTEAAAHGPEAGVAGQTARAYASYVGDHGQELLHLPGNHTLGEVNPQMVQAMSHGLAPYVNNIAGVSGGLAEFGSGLDHLDGGENGSLPLAKGVFAVLSTDAAASNHFNGAADSQALIAEGTYARELASHAPNMNSYNANLGDAMTLRGLVASGIHSAVQADLDNHHVTETAAESLEFDRRKTSYEIGVKTLAGLGGLIPTAGGVVGPLTGIFGQAIENDVVGTPPTSWPLTDHPLPDMTIGHVDREILNAAIASGQRVEGLSKYLIDGHIAAPDELESRHVPVLVSEYDHDLNQALLDMYTQIYGDDPRRPLVPDLHMMDRYNAVVKDPFPPKP